MRTWIININDKLEHELQPISYLPQSNKRGAYPSELPCEVEVDHRNAETLSETSKSYHS
jgi:hypothetical protein